MLLKTRVQRSAPLQSTDQRWRLVNEACIVDLLDKKVRDVGARDEVGAPVASVHKHAIRTCAPPVGHDSRTDNCPIEPASPYDPLLCVLVGVNTTKNPAKSSVVKESPRPRLSPAPKSVMQIKRLTALDSIALTRTRVATENRRVPPKISSGVGDTPSV